MTNHAIAPQKAAQSMLGERLGGVNAPQNVMHKREIAFILWKCYDNWQ